MRLCWPCCVTRASRRTKACPPPVCADGRTPSLAICLPLIFPGCPATVGGGGAAVALAAAALVALVALVALCAGKKKKSPYGEPEIADMPEELRAHRERASTVAMSTNPLFRSQNSHAVVSGDAAAAPRGRDLDEDELANSGNMTSHEVRAKGRRHRREGVARLADARTHPRIVRRTSGAPPSTR